MKKSVSMTLFLAAICIICMATAAAVVAQDGSSISQEIAIKKWRNYCPPQRGDLANRLKKLRGFAKKRCKKTSGEDCGCKTCSCEVVVDETVSSETAEDQLSNVTVVNENNITTVVRETAPKASPGSTAPGCDSNCCALCCCESGSCSSGGCGSGCCSTKRTRVQCRTRGCRGCNRCRPVRARPARRAICCPQCDAEVCQLKVEETKEKRSCFKVECKTICVPKIRMPWDKCCDPLCGPTRKIKVLKKHSFECPACKYSWEKCNVETVEIVTDEKPAPTESTAVEPTPANAKETPKDAPKSDPQQPADQSPFDSAKSSVKLNYYRGSKTIVGKKR